MQVSMSRLLQGAIDYAGIFPPARLSMEESVDRYLRALESDDEWIVSRFVCSASRLDELASVLEAREKRPFFSVSAVGSPSTDRGTWETALEADAKAMNAFDRRMGESGAVEAFEAKIPENAGIAGYAKDLGGFSEADVFAELPWGEGMDDALALLAETQWLGAKARTGGLEASAFPDPYTLAGFLRQCVDLELPFKLTAGLHHPLPHRDPSIGVTMHGFLNVAAATALALSDDLSKREMERLLLDADPTAWTFDAKGFEWRGRRVELGDIDEARDLFISFGSCSIDEPLQDLAAIKAGT